MIKVPEDELARGRKIQEAQQLSVAAPILIPLLNQYREDAISKVTKCVRTGEGHLLPGYAAELHVIETLRYDIEQKLNGLNLIGGPNGSARK